MRFPLFHINGSREIISNWIVINGGITMIFEGYLQYLQNLMLVQRSSFLAKI
jgi:hypothetical protein